MSSTSKSLAPVIALFLLGASSLAMAQTPPTQGMIISHSDNKLVVRTPATGTDQTIMLTPSTKIEAVVGLVGARREAHPATDLIKGLAVSIETAQRGDEVDAVAITFKPNDLKTAQAVGAGTAEAREKILAAQAENERRLAEGQKRLAEGERRLSLVGQFETKDSVRVLFDTGKTAINAKGKEDLKTIASVAAANPGYLIRVVGHADSTGNAAANQRLSNQRASAVTAYLLQSAKVSPDKIATAGGLGAYVPIEADASPASLAQNRRVTVFVVVSKASQTSATPTP